MQRTLFDYAPKKVAATATAMAQQTVHYVDENSGSVSMGFPHGQKRARSASPANQCHAATRTGSAADGSGANGNGLCSSRWLADLVDDAQWGNFLQPLTSDGWRDGQFARIEEFLDGEAAAGRHVLPPREDIFAAFRSTPFDQVKVVLLGQDPYHDIGQAHGLCFSVRPGVRTPPSLQNMYKELATDVDGFQIPSHGYLMHWARQGMLMLNATLTVEAHNANSHSKCGWQLFTDDVIRLLSQSHNNRIVFLLWGNFAKKKKALINCQRHIVIEAAHPSPLSARHWFGCKCFSQCNEALVSLGHTPMHWHLPKQV